MVLLTLLGAASEAVGHDRLLKTNTAKRRTHSLFRQDCMLYDLIPTMPESRLRPLMECFGALAGATAAGHERTRGGMKYEGESCGLALLVQEHRRLLGFCIQFARRSPH